MAKLFSPTRYEIVDGIFKQTSPDFNGKNYEMLDDSFGLIDNSIDRWKKFNQQIEKLNLESDDHTTYKVFYVARHGQGFHNVAETQYGTPLWNCYWSRLNGNHEATWGPDGKLTELGISQAEAVNAAWKIQIKDGVPLPTVLYCSPLSRSASTLFITWDDILIKQGLKPIFKEMWRETIGLHTCDKRSTKSYLERNYSDFDFEVPFAEEDLLYTVDYQETLEEQTLRTKAALNQLFQTDSNIFISITAHSGTINSFFRAVNHPHHTVLPGGFVPIVVKACM